MNKREAFEKNYNDVLIENGYELIAFKRQVGYLSRYEAFSTECAWMGYQAALSSQPELIRTDNGAVIMALQAKLDKALESLEIVSGTCNLAHPSWTKKKILALIKTEAQRAIKELNNER
jgi:hypothetical protein